MSDPITLAEFQTQMNRLNQWAQHGCSDGFCRIEKPKGMHTNGGCQCRPNSFAASLLQLANDLEKHGRHSVWPTP